LVVAVAFAVAPLAAELALAVIGPPERFDLLALLGMAIMVYPFIAVPMLLVAGPLYLLLRHFDKVNLLTILGGGILTGCLASLVVLDARVSDYHVFRDVMAAGTAAGLVFWLIWRLRKTSGCDDGARSAWVPGATSDNRTRPQQMRGSPVPRLTIGHGLNKCAFSKHHKNMWQARDCRARV
jgi:hypothetical protein